MPESKQSIELTGRIKELTNTIKQLELNQADSPFNPYFFKITALEKANTRLKMLKRKHKSNTQVT